MDPEIGTVTLPNGVDLAPEVLDDPGCRASHPATTAGSRISNLVVRAHSAAGSLAAKLRSESLAAAGFRGRRYLRRLGWTSKIS